MGYFSAERVSVSNDRNCQKGKIKKVKKKWKKWKNDKKCKNCQNEDKNQMEKLVKIKQNRIQTLETSYVKQKIPF